MPYIMQVLSPIPIKHALHNKHANQQFGCVERPALSNKITVPSLRPSKKFLKLINGEDKWQTYSKIILQEKAFNTMDKIKMRQDEKEWYDGFKKRVLEHECNPLNMTELRTLINGEDDFIEVMCNIDGLGEICYYTAVC